VLRRRFDDALLALGRPDALSAHLPDASPLLDSFVCNEVVLSSQIEGTQSSLADLLLYEIDEQPGVPVEDARKVSRCVAALEHGLAALRGGLPLSWMYSPVMCLPVLSSATHRSEELHREVGGNAEGIYGRVAPSRGGQASDAVAPIVSPYRLISTGVPRCSRRAASPRT
jgi:Fic family protein